jgi:hypothetical protein
VPVENGAELLLGLVREPLEDQLHRGSGQCGDPVHVAAGSSVGKR